MMRVPNKHAPLVAIPGGGSAGYNAGKAGLEPGAAKMSMSAVAAAFRGNSRLDPLADAMAAATKATEAIVKDIQIKRAETDANNAFAQLNGDLHPFLHGENGIYARRGVGANGVVEDTRIFFEKDVAKLSKSMNEATKKLFEEQAMRLRVSTQVSVAQHAGRELQQALFDSRLASITAEMDFIRNNPSDVRGGAEAMGRIRENAALIARQKGMNAEAAKNFIGKAVSAAQRGQIESFAQFGKFEMAFAIWKNTKDDLTADDRMQTWAGIRKAAWEFFKQKTVDMPQAFLDVAREDGWDKESGDDNDEAGFARRMNPETIGDMLSPVEKRALVQEAEGRAVAYTADDTAKEYMALIEAGEDAYVVEKEILGLPPKIRNAVHTQFNAYLRGYKMQQQEFFQDAVIDMRTKMPNMTLSEQFKFVQDLPGTTDTERKIKKQMLVDYAHYAANSGMQRTTDPDAYNELLDKIIYGDIAGPEAVKQLKSDPLVVKVAATDLKKLEADLKGASAIPDAELKAVYLWASGTNGEPFAGTLSKAKKANQMRFIEWVRGQTLDTNRAKEPGYARELARLWKMGGEIEGGSPFGFGLNKDFNEAMADPSWLPDIPADINREIVVYFTENPDIAKEWYGKYEEAEYARRAFYKAQLLSGIGRHARPEQEEAPQ
jgi:hypothetical protein